MDTTDGHKETLPMLEEKQFVKEEKTKQVIEETEFPDELEKNERETEQIKRMAKTKCYRKTKLNWRNFVIETTKEVRVELERTSSKTNYRFFLNLYFDFPWDINLPGDLQSFDINCLLKYNNYFNDNILNYAEHFLNQFPLHSKLEAHEIQGVIFDDLMVNILNTFNNATSLKYLNTYSDYLGFNSHTNCAFIYKKININTHNEDEALKNFVVCVGDLKSPNESLSKTSIIKEMLRNMRTILSVQRRKKIYGFLCNYLHIKFFYIEKDLDLNSYVLFQSQELEMFSYSSETLSATDKSRKLCVNKDTWKIFTKFLTMNSEFYEYTRLNIDPHDDLLADQYHIMKELGNGLTSMIFLLEENENEYSAEDPPNHVMKILKESEDSYLFSNEIKIIERLKQFNHSSKFQLFFQDILHPSCPDKYLLYEKELQCIDTLSLMQSKQLIDIMKYLYDCHIIHRHVRPENLMLDKDTSHIKLIDFTFAITYDADGKAGSIGVTDTIAYAGHEFLEYYSQLLFESRLPNYRYERTFDLKCALNVIMALNDVLILAKIYEIETLIDIHQITLEALLFWLDIRRANKDYSNLVNLISNLHESSTFDVLKTEIEKLFNY
ncbi:unnamed protein product [Rotaria magnacalcarata]|uniref:non-specific serine/threonine protein kinase n=1 Tax=Rotaria magnacalcarata TaxID=392030 RepID=A0A819X5H7_9BILA|nr:unnamed protein product [Rotaria magnacalcarata]CAF4136878.1 unnamed protein product [Rotaria magnacalcarata]